ncbi:MAG TPA: hypothetical protein PK400_02360 [Phycisphaerales bacterium]|nr:hypothetical protein [Phycisphaerales bacterium]HRQ75734.1 hypothetical protein [Phycisphaerales bacterium]
MNKLFLEPDPGSAFDAWQHAATAQPFGSMLGRSLAEWRELTRRQFGLPTDRPVLATGHQPTLWHPGILAKYLALDAACNATGFAAANVIVDQDVEDFSSFDAPLLRADGSLAVRRVELSHTKTDVPIALHEAFRPSAPSRTTYAGEFVAQGVQQIVSAIAQHADAPNAAIQMAHALEDLMQPWVKPITSIRATDLCNTDLAHAIIQHMAADPHACAEAYNRAISNMPEAGVPMLLVRDDYVELPLWRVGSDGKRRRAYDSDLHAWLELQNHSIASQSTVRRNAFGLMPRALLMTAIIRLGLCDLFIHGTGGARYDRIMEQWINTWLGMNVAPVAVVTATVRLPLQHETETDLATAQRIARKTWHDPTANAMAALNHLPSDEKRAMLEEVARHPRNSLERRRAYLAMHTRLENLREHSPYHEAVLASQQAFDRAKQAARNAVIASRRDWAFPLYPPAMIDDLAASIRAGVHREAAKRTA